MDKVKPENLWSIEAEAGVLGSMLIDPACIGAILPVLDENSFFKPEHQTIFNALIALFVAGVPIDAIALRTELKSLNQLEEIGGVEYIARLLNSVPSAANARYYAGVVKDRQRYRQLLRTVESIGKVVVEPLKVDEQVQQVQALALALEQCQPSKEFFSFADCANEPDSERAIFKTGLRNIDHIVGGFAAGELIIVAGRPSMGKSALALQIAINQAKAGLSVIYFTLEMCHRSLFKRAARNADINDLKSLNIVLHESADTPDKILAFLKTRKQIQNVDVVFIDYLQLMTCGRKNDNRVAEITEISRKLKRLAMTENVPVVALSQLNRQAENRENHRPRMSDLRESGSIEQDADVVMLLHREDYYRRQSDPNAPQDGTAEAIIAKNRRGAVGTASLIFLDEKVTFGDKTNFSESLI
jgi:replicative DNA helicase